MILLSLWIADQICHKASLAPIYQKMMMAWCVSFSMRYAPFVTVKETWAWCIGIWMLVLAAQDLASMKVDAWKLDVMCFLAFVYWYMQGACLLDLSVSIILPLFFIIGNHFRKMIGSADITLIWISCWMFGFDGLLAMILVASLSMLVIWLFDRRSYYPFVPALAFAMQVMLRIGV
ncbi:hypothetical protein [Massilicoli timonensis]|uniref:Prepilin type IV endopeptidase peptidase domain-containing protein n=1 Tax=Massilicoli timonensis TaxID=2015901 RepID=A0ABT1SJM7_9FIRM|nr:hypothetical protein [Massilicoli timonensis]MCQ5121415.1 hypothetical protein [Massilicoli timonensis]